MLNDKIDAFQAVLKGEIIVSNPHIRGWFLITDCILTGFIKL